MSRRARRRALRSYGSAALRRSEIRVSRGPRMAVGRPQAADRDRSSVPDGRPCRRRVICNSDPVRLRLLRTAHSPFRRTFGEASARRSVSRVLSCAGLRRPRDGHPSGAAGCPTAHAADPRAGQRTSPPPTVARPRVAPSYLALLRVEFARFTPVGGLRRRPASSLWHWSSPHGGRALPATLRCGARTFLTPHDGSPHRRRAAIRPPR